MSSEAREIVAVIASERVLAPTTPGGSAVPEGSNRVDAIPGIPTNAHEGVTQPPRCWLPHSVEGLRSPRLPGSAALPAAIKAFERHVRCYAVPHKPNAKFSSFTPDNDQGVPLLCGDLPWRATVRRKYTLIRM